MNHELFGVSFQHSPQVFPQVKKRKPLENTEVSRGFDFSPQISTGINGILLVYIMQSV